MRWWRRRKSEPQRAFGAALFVPAPSPGQVFRLLERRLGRTPEDRARLTALDLRLSEDSGLGEPSHRVLFSANYLPDFRPWSDGTAGPVFSEAFPDAPVTLLWAEPQKSDTGGGAWEWGFAEWEGGQEKTRQVHAVLPEPAGTRRGLWKTNPVRAFLKSTAPFQQATIQATLWMANHQLNFFALPAINGGRRKGPWPPPLVEYATVARLDQKGLLVENEPRWYCFDFGSGPP